MSKNVKFEYLMDTDLNTLGAQVEAKLQKGYSLAGGLIIQYRDNQAIGFIQAVGKEPIPFS